MPLHRFFPIQSLFLTGILVITLLSRASNAQVSVEKEAYSPIISLASDEARLAMKRFQLPDGFQIDLFAAEPLLANPVTFTLDYQGRMYVAETFRHSTGVADTRNHMYWLDDDLAARTVSDRIAMFEKYLGQDGVAQWRQEHERIRMLMDVDGDGQADTSTVFADGFNSLASGIGAGLLVRDHKVWYACIPHLWQLHDKDRDGKAESRQALHYGYGVHVGYLGHDLHGLCLGPDGKLYFSIGDRGLSVKTPNIRIDHPDSGAILRCNLDGSNLELYATGLRNPQELAFDNYGNLFTVDNNSDSGDQARLVHVVEGGDSGWRIGYQFINNPQPRGPWNSEKLWHPHFPGQAAYIVPPLANISNGPSGLSFYPGTGLDDRFNNHFFLCDFRGSAAISGIHSFSVTPSGASYKISNFQPFIWNILATDIDFGTAGEIYVSDWVQGWSKPAKGRIYRIYDPTARDNDKVREVHRILADSLSRYPTDMLGELLQHSDRRVRQESQFELVRRNQSSRPLLLEIAIKGNDLLARIHAIWGLGQIAQQEVIPSILDPLQNLITDPHDEIRAQIARVMGDSQYDQGVDMLKKLLQDSSNRVRFFAANSLGKLKPDHAIEDLFTLIRENDNRDPYLRHAGVMGLVGTADVKSLLGASNDPSSALRLAIVLTLRKKKDPAVSHFLNDPDPAVVLEASRAIYDTPISESLPQLASLITRHDLPIGLMRRVLNANFHLSSTTAIQNIVSITSDQSVAMAIRLEALSILRSWPKPSGRDRITGLWRPVKPVLKSQVAHLVQPTLASLIQDPEPQIQQSAILMAGDLSLAFSVDALTSLLRNHDNPPLHRQLAVTSLTKINPPKLLQILRTVIDDPQDSVRAIALRSLAKLQPREAVEPLREILTSGSIANKQSALHTLGELSTNGADRILSEWMHKLLEKDVEKELYLDLLAASKKRPSRRLQKLVSDYESQQSSENLFDTYRETLWGGNENRGRDLFFNKISVSCMRCHRAENRGGTVGPDLAGIGEKRDRSYLLQSLITPNQHIAEGYGTTLITTVDGKVHTGIIRQENESMIQIVTVDAEVELIEKETIDLREQGLSAMPEDLVKQLTKSEVRDLVEFLVQLKQ